MDTFFLVRLGKQQDAEAARGRAVDTRILASNALYEALIDLCAIGKARSAPTDARQHQHDVVTAAPADTAPPQPGAPTRWQEKGARWGALFWVWVGWNGLFAYWHRHLRGAKPSSTLPGRDRVYRYGPQSEY